MKVRTLGIGGGNLKIYDYSFNFDRYKRFKAQPDIKIIKQKLIKKYGKPDFSYGDGKGKDIYTIKK